MKPLLSIVIPVFNDWEAVECLLLRIDDVIAADRQQARIVLVDDGSEQTGGQTDQRVETLTPFRAIISTEIIVLRTNLGHQRAICVGLAYCRQNYPGDPVLVMDGDGEDDPVDIPRLAASGTEGQAPRIVFAERGSRTEPVPFRIMYFLYRTAFRILVGRNIRFGNFSYIPAALLHRVACLPDLWTHYSAAVLRARLPLAFVRCDRSFRLSGNSKMGWISLVIHGLRALSVFGDVIGARALIASAVFGICCMLVGISAIFIRLATSYAIPGWTSSVVGLSIVLTLQCFTLSLVFMFITLTSRNASGAVLNLESEDFIRDVIRRGSPDEVRAVGRHI